MAPPHSLALLLLLPVLSLLSLSSPLLSPLSSSLSLLNYAKIGSRHGTGLYCIVLVGDFAFVVLRVLVVGEFGL